MAYEISADKYAFCQTPQPEKVDENYNAVLLRKLMQEEASKRESLKSHVEQNVTNEVYARTEADEELRSQIVNETVAREGAVSELGTRISFEAQTRQSKDEEFDARLLEEKEQRAAADASFLQAADELEADLSTEAGLRQAGDNELLKKVLLKADAEDVYTKDYINEVKEDRVTIITISGDDLGDSSSFGWNGPDNHNTETRILTSALDTLNIEWWDGEYPEDYIASLSFNSGEVPTCVSYPMGGIINWIGTDCVLYDGISIFQPSANTHYEIVMYYNGTQCIGLVNGFVPSIQEVDFS